MGRRKKEPRNVHRENIAEAAQGLFSKKGVTATSMDEIAKAAGYSKATLYVYFENKEEIVGVLVMQSMKKLYDYMVADWDQQGSAKEQYAHYCKALIRYQEEYPYYFSLVLDNINVDFENTLYSPEERETYEVGEQLNDAIEAFIRAGIDSGEFRQDLEIRATMYAFWGMMSGLIQIAENKAVYFEQQTGLSKHEFIRYGFDMLYRSIVRKEE